MTMVHPPAAIRTDLQCACRRAGDVPIVGFLAAPFLKAHQGLPHHTEALSTEAFRAGTFKRGCMGYGA